MTFQQKTGECEVCTNVDVTLTLMHGNTWMCPSCRAEDVAISAKNRVVPPIDFNRKIDSIIELKADIFVATTKSFTDTQAEILADDSIPADRKAPRLMEIITDRIKVLDAAIFAEKAATVVKENERYSLLKNAQEVASKLRESERAKYKQYDVTYQPPVVKTIKPKAIKKTPAFKMQDLKVAAANTGLPMSAIRAKMLSKGLSAEDAAKELMEFTK